MSCGFCHVGPSPVKPPEDPENPKWENLNSNPGAQYFWVDRVLFWEKDQANFVYQLIHTSLPGTLDTSFMSSDYINNPRTMNAVYNVGARLKIAERWGEEKLAGGGAQQQAVPTLSSRPPCCRSITKSRTRFGRAHVLKDGADSVGILGALESGLYQHRICSARNGCCISMRLVGGQKVTPIQIADAEKNSSYWNATAGADAGCRAVFSQDGKTRFVEGRARRRRSI